MTGIEMTALTLVAGWLGILSVVLLLTIRQIALLSARLDRNVPLPLDRDGLDIGAMVPDEVIQTLPQLADGTIYLLLLSSTCSTCREVASSFGAHDGEEQIVALVPGPEELADALIGELPERMTTIRDPIATEVASKMQLETTPFAFEIDGGKVSGKAYLHSYEDYLDLSTFKSRVENAVDTPKGVG